MTLLPELINSIDKAACHFRELGFKPPYYLHIPPGIQLDTKTILTSAGEVVVEVNDKLPSNSNLATLWVVPTSLRGGDR